jgi:hypothetical protein
MIASRNVQVAGEVAGEIVRLQDLGRTQLVLPGWTMNAFGQPIAVGSQNLRNSVCKLFD